MIQNVISEFQVRDRQVVVIVRVNLQEMNSQCKNSAICSVLVLCLQYYFLSETDDELQASDMLILTAEVSQASRFEHLASSCTRIVSSARRSRFRIGCSISGKTRITDFP